MKICIVTSKHVSYNPRVVKEADALSSAGHDVSVVTVCNNVDQAILDEGVMATRSWRLFTVRYRKAGLIEKSRWLWFGLRQRLFERYLSRLTLRFGVAERAQGREYPELRRLACSARADLYIVHHVEALGAAYAAARKHGARFAFDAEDFHSGMFSAPVVPVQADSLKETVRMHLAETEALPKSREQQRIEYLESKYLPQCGHITAASDGIAEAYALKYNIPRPATVLNVFPLENRGKILDLSFKEVADGVGKDDLSVLNPESRIQNPASNPSPFTLHPSQPIRLYWYSQVIGAGRGLEDAVKALALWGNSCELHLRGTQDDIFVSSLISLATQLGVRERLFIHPPCPPGDLVTEAATYDIGLALETGKEINNLLAASNKIFAYFNAGLAVVATDTPGQRGIMSQASGAGMVCKMNDPKSLAEAVNILVGSMEKLRAAQAAARSCAASRFNWEREAAKLVELITGGSEEPHGHT